MILATAIAIVTAIATIKEVESVKYRNDLKARKAERLAALAEQERKEREEDVAKQEFISAFLQK